MKLLHFFNNVNINRKVIAVAPCESTIRKASEGIPFITSLFTDKELLVENSRLEKPKRRKIFFQQWLGH
jgi:hypothetical protein